MEIKLLAKLEDPIKNQLAKTITRKKLFYINKVFEKYKLNILCSVVFK